MLSPYQKNTLPLAAVILCLALSLPLLILDAEARGQAPAAGRGDDPFQAAGLVDLRTLDAGFAYDLRYATTNNFTGVRLYSEARPYLRAETAAKLAAANREFMAMGYRIKIFDAYRPYSVQRILYEAVPPDQKGFIANPDTGGSNHNRGAAVDMTIERLDGTPVPMPTDFDTFDRRANINCRACTREEAANRELMAAVMARHGFKQLNCEWWHFDDTEANKYDILDLKI